MGRRVLGTKRLVLREFDHGDAEFIVRLLNEPSFIANIADRGVRTIQDALSYLDTGPLAMYREHALGLYRVERSEDGQVVGMCGLLVRDELPDPDIGFALLPEYWGRGYAVEAAAATLADGRDRLGLGRIVAITSLDNEASRRVLERLGLQLEGVIPWHGEEVRLFAIDYRQGEGA